jgi:hypothetical protein
MKKPIFDIDIIPEKFRHPKMAELRALLKKNLGGPCPYFNPGCVVCRSWHAFMVLDEIFELWGPKRLDKKPKKKRKKPPPCSGKGTY